MAARKCLKVAIIQSVRQLFKLERVFNVILERDVQFLVECVDILNSSAILPIDRIRISRMLATRDDALDAVDRLLTPIMRSAEDVADREAAEFELSLCRIAQGRFAEAMALLSPERAQLQELGIARNFNYAMAEWGATGKLPADLFHRVLEIHEHAPQEGGANYLQCLAIASWAEGRPSDAQSYLKSSDQALVDNESTITFSAWRYLYVTSDLFREDLTAIEAMAMNAGPKPLIFRH